MSSTLSPGSPVDSPSGLHVTRGPRWALGAFLSLVGLGLAIFFWLPTRIPVPAIYSESYNYGFNNHVAQRILGAVLILAFLGAKALDLHLPAPKRSTTSHDDLTRRTFLTSFLVMLFLGAFLYWMTRPSGGILDGSYFMDRIHLIERGQHPYRDFEWVYGSFPLYASIALAHVLHLPSIDGYNTLFVLENLFGVVMLWFGLRFFDIHTGGRRVVFLLYFVFGLSLMAGVALNYTLLRYSLPLFCVTALTRIDRDATPRTRLLTLLFALTSIILLLGLSPEEGIALGAATCCFLPVRRLALRRPWVLDTFALIALFAGCVLYANHAGLFTTMRSFGAGAFNLPLWPDPPMLLLLGALLVVGGFLATGRLRSHLASNVTFVAIFSLAMLAGALGRADLPHIAGYELSLFTAALLLLWQWPITWRLSIAAFLLTFILLPAYLSLGSSVPLYGKVLLLHLYRNGQLKGKFAAHIDAYATRRAASTLGPEVAAKKMEAMRKAVGGNANFDPHIVFPHSSPIVFAPFNYRPNKLSVYQSPSIDEGYYFGQASITSVVNAERKLDDLRAHPERDLVVSNENFLECGPFVMPPSAMRTILLYPFVPPVKHPVTVFIPVCDYIHSNYHWVQTPNPQTFGYGLMRHN